MQIHRGELYYANIDPAIDSEQPDSRLVLIIQSNIGNRYSTEKI